MHMPLLDVDVICYVCLRLTCLCSNHEGSVAIIVLVIDVNLWACVQHGDYVNKPLDHSQHQSILRGIKVDINVLL